MNQSKMYNVEEYESKLGQEYEIMLGVCAHQPHVVEEMINDLNDKKFEAYLASIPSPYMPTISVNDINNNNNQNEAKPLPTFPLCKVICSNMGRRVTGKITQ